MRTKPDPQQLPCPQQRIELQCRILVPTETLTWSLPSGDSLSFRVTRNIGDVEPSPPDGVYSATLTEKTEDNDPNTDLFFFASTLLVLEPVNGSTLTCGGAATGVEVESSTTIAITGMHSYYLALVPKALPVQYNI